MYLDTSVIGGCRDEEFAEASRRVMEKIRQGDIVALLSTILADELEQAPADVKAVVASLPPANLEFLAESVESRRLRDLYIEARVVGRTHENDAHHVAIATVARADIIVSWNFKDIVHYDKIRGFNAVNLREGYGVIAIHSPLEVV